MQTMQSLILNLAPVEHNPSGLYTAVQVQFAETTGVLALMRQKDPHKENPIHQFEKDLLSSLETSDLDMPLNLVWHTFILLAKGPLPLRE